MVARNSLAFSIEKCDGHGLRGLTATGKKNPRHQDSRQDQMSEAMGCKPTPFRAVHDRIHRLDPDENGISFPRLSSVGHKRLECDPRTRVDFPRLHEEMLAKIAARSGLPLVSVQSGMFPRAKIRYLEDSCLQPPNLCPLALTPSGGRTSANANGEPCAKIIPPTAMPGTTFPTTTRAAGRIAGAKTAWREFATGAEAVLCARVVERPGPNFERAVVRPYQRRGQPR